MCCDNKCVDTYVTSVSLQYDAVVPGGHGTGGEYVNQIGFGWTNGVIMELLDKYGQLLTVSSSINELESGSSSLVANLMTLTIISATVLLVRWVYM
jgi:hypothetical protein